MESKRYKVMGDTKNTFLNIELDLVLDDDSIGATCNVLGGSFTITQNGVIIVLTNPDWCLTLMDVTPEPEKVVPKLIINETLEVYFETKEIAVKCECTYEELFKALKDEWVLISSINDTPFPLEYDEKLKLLTFKDEWGFEGGNYSLLSVGSFTRLNASGRCMP